MKELRGYGGKDDARRLYGEAQRKFGGLSENALMDRLLDEVARQKQSGTFNEEQLLGFVNTLSPHLSAEQRKKLEDILGKIEA
ncbi:MAG: hypothetical protein K2M95_02295 [Clostridiales bacterium]|nr:hypothetical protein [Clostridiales bacterium]